MNENNDRLKILWSQYDQLRKDFTRHSKASVLISFLTALAFAILGYGFHSLSEEVEQMKKIQDSRLVP